MVHKPKHKVHSFRGLLGDGGQDEINLERSNVNLAYRIVKFQTISNQNTSGGAAGEHWTFIWREEQTSISSTTPNVDFTNTDLLGVDWSPNNAERPFAKSIIFDNILFSRNIYVTHMDIAGSESCNYYIEIEEVPVEAATLMQLKLQVARKLNLQQD
jgi:hypothetical protein